MDQYDYHVLQLAPTSLFESVPICWDLLANVSKAQI